MNKWNIPGALNAIEKNYVDPKMQIAAQITLSQIKLSATKKFPGTSGIMATNNAVRKVKKSHYQVYNDLEFAAIQEFGGVIRADQAGALTVPLNKEAKDLRKQHKSLRSIPDLYAIKSKKDNLLLMKDDKPMFALVKSVHIKATHFMKIGMRDAKKYIGKHL